MQCNVWSLWDKFRDGGGGVIFFLPSMKEGGNLIQYPLRERVLVPITREARLDHLAAIMRGTVGVSEVREALLNAEWELSPLEPPLELAKCAHSPSLLSFGRGTPLCFRL